MNWWDFPVTQDHGVNGEQGVDFGTPLDTPITSLFAGVVQSASYGPWGGLVTVAVPDAGGRGPLTEYALHLDQIKVKPGDPVTPGSILGLSGGQLAGGQHPVTDSRYSSGPHLEYGFFSGAPFASAALDPVPIISGATSGNVQPVSDTTDPFTRAIEQIIGGPFLASGAAAATGKAATQGVADFNSGLTNIGTGVAAGLYGVGQGIQSIPTSIGHGLADAAGVAVHDAEVFLQRQVIALFVAALVLLVIFKL